MEEIAILVSLCSLDVNLHFAYCRRRNKSGSRDRVRAGYETRNRSLNGVNIAADRSHAGRVCRCAWSLSRKLSNSLFSKEEKPMWLSIIAAVSTAISFLHYYLDRKMFQFRHQMNRDTVGKLLF